MSCDIDGSNDVQDETVRTARKEHRCCACREIIRKGDRYRRTFVVYEGSPSTYKHCLRCGAMSDAIHARMRASDFDAWERGVAFNLNCGHDWQENFEEEPPPEIARLAFLTADEAQKELGGG